MRWKSRRAGIIKKGREAASKQRLPVIDSRIKVILNTLQNPNDRKNMADLRGDALRHMVKALNLLDLAGASVAACHLQLAIDRLQEHVGGDLSVASNEAGLANDNDEAG